MSKVLTPQKKILPVKTFHMEFPVVVTFMTNVKSFNPSKKIWPVKTAGAHAISLDHKIAIE